VPLPPLAPGQHTLELASFVTVNGTVLESDRSTPLQVTVTAAAAPADATPPQDSALSTSEGHRFRASIVAAGLDDPTDLAIAPDGRVLVTERAGRVRIVGAEGLLEPPALELHDVATSDESGLTGIALHPDFDRNGRVYLAYAAETRDGAAFRIARFRERAGVLGQGAIIAGAPTPSAHHVVLRVGWDGKLYAGLSAGNDPSDAQRPASAAGKVLRLNEDGSTPRDNPRPSATFTSGHRDPRAFAWHPTGVMWELERDREAGDELNTIVGGSDYGWPLARGSSSYSGSVPALLVLPAGTDISGAVFIPPDSSSPLAGELIVASRGAEDLLRIRVTESGQRAGLIEGMLQGRYGRIAAVGVSPGGTIYFATANREIWGPARDVLIRLATVDRTTRR
jgi:aldose sugar dehydrogenase